MPAIEARYRAFFHLGHEYASLSQHSHSRSSRFPSARGAMEGWRLPCGSTGTLSVCEDFSSSLVSAGRLGRRDSVSFSETGREPVGVREEDRDLATIVARLGGKEELERT